MPQPNVIFIPKTPEFSEMDWYKATEFYSTSGYVFHAIQPATNELNVMADLEALKIMLTDLAHNTPQCGRDFCEACGDCLHCYGEFNCFAQGDEENPAKHSWVIHADKEVSQKQCKQLMAEVQLAMGIDITPYYREDAWFTDFWWAKEY